MICEVSINNKLFNKRLFIFKEFYSSLLFFQIKNIKN